MKKIAEDNGVTICVELLNSKVNHPDYQGDRTAFGVAVVKAVGSPRVKLLYDIYHMQIMEGDLIKTIRDQHDVHRALSHRRRPGRHELDARRRSTGPPSAAPSSTPASTDTSRTSSCRRAIR